MLQQGWGWGNRATLNHSWPRTRQYSKLQFFGNSKINLLKPTSCVHQQVLKTSEVTFYPQCIYVFCIHLRTNSDLCHLQHKLIGFYNRDEVFTARYGLGL